MIGQIETGSDFGGLFRYLLAPEKGARIIGGNVVGETADELTTEFNNCAKQRKSTKKPVKHFIIGFAPTDGVVKDELKANIAREIVSGLGYTNNQYVVVDHSRDDPGHHWVHNHDHIHIAVNMVNLEAERVNDWRDQQKLEKILRKQEIQAHLTHVPPSSQRLRKAPTTGQVQRFKHQKQLYKQGLLSNPPQSIASSKLQKAIFTASEDLPTMSEFVLRLQKMGVKVNPKITRNNIIQGISYNLDGIWFQGNQLHNCSFPKLQKMRGVKYDRARDLTTLRRFSHKRNEKTNLTIPVTQATNVNLNPERSRSPQETRSQKQEEELEL